MTRSPYRLKEQVRETVSELPIHAARLAVMGIGRALLLTDRVRKDYREARESGLGPVLGRLRDDAENLTGKVVHKVVGRPEDGDQAKEQPKRRPAADSEIVVGKPATSPAKPPASPAVPGASGPAAKTPRPAAAPKPVPDKAATTSRAVSKPPSVKELPVSGYDEASLASVRARLRGLDAGQVAQLSDYEQAHEARADFLRMFENRIAKLKSGG